MKKCYFTKKNRIIRYFCLFCATVCSCIMLGISYAFWHEAFVACMLLLVFGVIVLLDGVLFDVYFTREYELTEQGILIRYAKSITKLYRWENISQICICSIHRSANGATWDEVLWCTIGKIKKGPPHPSRSWNSTEYSLLHFRTVLTMEYTPERLDEFRKFYIDEIADYR